MCFPKGPIATASVSDSLCDDAAPIPGDNPPALSSQPSDPHSDISSPLPRKTIRTRICIISDTHGHTLSIPQCDILIHCGDLTRDGKHDELKGQVDMLQTAPAELKLVIAGNHDITLDKTYYERYGVSKHGMLHAQDVKACRALFTGPDAIKAGVRYLDEGCSTHTLAKKGVSFKVYASPYQPEFCNWAFPYRRDQDRYNKHSKGANPTPFRCRRKGRIANRLDPNFQATNPVPDFPAIDLMITHGPPAKILDRTWRGPEAGCANLLLATRRAKPLLHCFGHIHEDRGMARVDWTVNEQAGPDSAVRELVSSRESEQRLVIEGQEYDHVDLSSEDRRPLNRGAETLFVNASIMNVQYQPMNGPWIVDLDLPVSKKA